MMKKVKINLLKENYVYVHRIVLHCIALYCNAMYCNVCDIAQSLCEITQSSKPNKEILYFTP